MGQRCVAHEQEMLSALFDVGANPDVNLSDLQNHFYTSLPGIRDAILNALVGDGYYLHRPDSVRQGYIGTGFILGNAAVFVGGGWLAGVTGMAPFTWLLAGILTGLIICGFGWFMPARTITGVRTREKGPWLRGFSQPRVEERSDRASRRLRARAIREIPCHTRWLWASKREMGAGIFRHRHAATIVVSGLIRRRLSALLPGE